MNILTTAGRTGAVVLGFGISNVPLCDFLLGRGIPVEVRDAKSRETLAQHVDIDAYERRGVRFALGEHYLDDIPAAVIFRTPGIRPDAGGIPDAVRRGAMALFLKRNAYLRGSARKPRQRGKGRGDDSFLGMRIFQIRFLP